jgi:hypothetical protein
LLVEPLDIEDVALRVLWRLMGVEAQIPELTDQSILVAEDLPPSILISLDRARLAGFATVRGGPTSHVAILARSMGMPAVAGLPVATLALPEHAELARLRLHHQLHAWNKRLDVTTSRLGLLPHLLLPFQFRDSKVQSGNARPR